VFRTILPIWAALLAAALSSVASAEELDKDQREIVGFAGSHSQNENVVFGGGFQEAASTRYLVALEVGYARSKDEANSRIASEILTADANLHRLIPLQSRKNFTPYAVFGFGAWGGYSNRFVRGATAQTWEGFVGLNLGAGARVRLKRGWGLRPEFKFLVIPGAHNVRLSLGLYKRIH
jgi:hypothetical protein